MGRLRRPLLLLAVLAGGGAGAATGQIAPVGVPKGYLRVEFFGRFESFDRRFHGGNDEFLAEDFLRASAGSNLFPALAPADEILARVTGLPDARINIGRTTADWSVVRGTGGFSLAFGLTSRLTLFGSVPITRVVVRSTLGLDSTDSRGGFNPADPVFGDPLGQSQTASFFTQFDAALTSLQQNINQGVYDGDPAQKALAVATLGFGTSLRGDLHALLLAAETASPFLPIQSSPEGTALVGRVTALQTTLSGSLGVAGFTETPALPTARLSDPQLTSFVTSSAGPVAGSLETPTVTALGDIELGAAYTLVDQLGRPDARGGFRATGQALVRLQTSTRPQASEFFSVGTGERQPDVELGLTGDFLQPRWGARLVGSYNLQLQGKMEARITAPEHPLPYASALANLTRNPGNIWSVGLSPFLRLAETFSVAGGVQYASKGEDRVDLAGGQEPIPGAPPELLALESSASWTTASAGLVYASPLRFRNGKPINPLDAGVLWQGVVAGSGGRVPRASAIRVYLRLYTRFR
jgi:hypothetical protein